MASLERRPALEHLVHSVLERRRLAYVLTQMRRQGVRIDVVYDIGAHRGEWTKSVRARLPGARFYLFEANAVHAAALRDSGDAFFIAVLSSESRLVDFYGTGGPGDSYYREATEHYSGVSPQRIETTTLDHLVATHDLPLADLVKADVQGAELDVLRGGRHALKKAKLVLLECPLAEYNEGAPSMADYLRFMHESGFSPVAFVEAIWQQGAMVQVDVLFGRQGHGAT